MLVRARPYLNSTELMEAIVSKSDESAIQNFEEQFAKKISVPKCFAVHQGRDAISFALRIIGIQQGDQVIVPNFICEVAVDAILSVGAVPVLIDNSFSEFNPTVDEFQKAITPQTKAILSLHLYGIPTNVDQLRALADQHGIFLIEDCAHTLTSTLNGGQVGSFGHLSFFSFNFDKPMSLGLGGMLVVNSSDLIEKAESIFEEAAPVSNAEEQKIMKSLLLQHFLTDDKIYSSFLPIHFSREVMDGIPGVSREIEAAIRTGSTVGLRNVSKKLDRLKTLSKIQKRIVKLLHRKQPTLPMKMNALRAAFGMMQLKHWERVNSKRQTLGAQYETMFKMINNFEIPTVDSSKSVVYSRFTVLARNSDQRNGLIGNARATGIELDHSNWNRTICAQAAYRKNCVGDSKSLRISEEFASRIIHFPTHYYVEDKHVDLITDILRKG